MAMKPVFKFLVATGVCVAANAVCAQYKWAASPYLGLEYKLSYTKGKDSWKRLLPTNNVNQNGTVFAGVKFHDCVAGELGFTKSNKNTKTSSIDGVSMFGTVIAGSNFNTNSYKQEVKLSYKSWNLDVNGQYPAGNSFAFLGTIGVASIKPKVEAKAIGSAPNNVRISTIEGKSKTALRLGVGAQYTQGMFGVRTRLMWEGTSRLRVNTGTYNTVLPNITEKPFKDTLAWTLGAFVRW
jgi:hypothetical protein